MILEVLHAFCLLLLLQDVAPSQRGVAPRLHLTLGVGPRFGFGGITTGLRRRRRRPDADVLQVSECDGAV